eukprot:CAMPEP_0115165856 /NCGR_PEP_ID=MMETSP0227-20121206/73818_1 /TAXON_ID=89957 /ORGANISM="Polarella glacialis, Strain CCMP 1383" /LENGTH=179 /DNA_ID=CAMNT_0002578361 /DNA_START=109 /DNA_END=647 /DNA_ORIENTATION=-
MAVACQPLRGRALYNIGKHTAQTRASAVKPANVIALQPHGAIASGHFRICPATKIYRQQRLQKQRLQWPYREGMAILRRGIHPQQCDVVAWTESAKPLSETGACHSQADAVLLGVHPEIHKPHEHEEELHAPMSRRNNVSELLWHDDFMDVKENDVSDDHSPQPIKGWNSLSARREPRP